MNKTAKAIFIMLVVISAVFVFAIVSMQQSMAYHSIFASKKECRSFFIQGVTLHLKPIGHAKKLFLIR